MQYWAVFLHKRIFMQKNGGGGTFVLKFLLCL